jgi:heat-inducible transcriptional repressor
LLLVLARSGAPFELTRLRRNSSTAALTSLGQLGILLTMVLGDRKQKILGAVVRDYVDTVRPVGSEDLAARYASWGVKSATIRNELAELADLGLLRQPHTSAGRIPSDQGYRFYVDHLMSTENPSQFAAAAGERRNTSLDLESLLRHTCALLTRITSYTSVATPPRPSDTVLNGIFLTLAGDMRVLVALVLSTGQVRNRLIAASIDASGSDLASLGSAVNAWLGGKPIETINSPTYDAIEDSVPDTFSQRMRSLYTLVAQAVRHAIKEVGDEDQVFLEGATAIFKQPEFRDSDKTESVLETLHRGAVMFQMVARSHMEVTVVIGGENKVEAMHECSVVTAPYYVGTKLRGTIGVVGPTRMHYDRAVPAVDFFASSLSSTLTYLSA